MEWRKNSCQLETLDLQFWCFLYIEVSETMVLYMCGRDGPKMESDLRGTDGEKTVSIELSANPCFFSVM